MEMIYPGTHGWLWCPNFVLFEWKYLITLQWSMPTLYCVFSATYKLTSVKRAADSQLVKLGFVCCVLICQKTECCSFTTKIVSDPKDPWRTSEKVHRSGTWWHSSGSLEWRWLMFHGRKPVLPLSCNCGWCSVRFPCTSSAAERPPAFDSSPRQLAWPWPRKWTLPVLQRARWNTDEGWT